MTSITIPPEILAQLPPPDPAKLAKIKRQGFAWVEPGGRIRVGTGYHRCKKGSHMVAIGDRRRMRNLFQVVSRHGWEPGVILVPGMPEAATLQDAEDALLDWLDWIAKRERQDIHLIGANKPKEGRSTADERFARTATMLSEKGTAP